jgi:hypothetical protein
MNGYYLCLAALIFLGFIAFKISSLIVQYIAGPIIGIYLMYGIYITFIYDIHLFNKYAWWGNKLDAETDIFDVLISIGVFFFALFLILQPQPW